MLRTLIRVMPPNPVDSHGTAFQHERSDEMAVINVLSYKTIFFSESCFSTG